MGGHSLDKVLRNSLTTVWSANFRMGLSLENGTGNGRFADPAADRNDPSPPDRAAPYHLRLIGETPRVANGCRLDGVVRNTSAKAWTTSHRVGLRDFRTADGSVIEDFELRAELSPGRPRPGQTASFRFDFVDLALAADVVACTLDIVEDGAAWLGDEGGEARQLEVIGEGGTSLSDWLLLIDELSSHAGTADRDRLTLIQQVLVRHDLKQAPNALRLRKRLLAAATGQSYSPLQPASSTIMAALPPMASDCERESVFLRHFAAMTGESFDANHPEKGGHIFSRFVREAAERFCGACVPLPSQLLTWLDERALPPSIAGTPASRAMVAVLGADEPLALNPHDSGREQIWTYATAVMIDRRLPREAMPSQVLRELARAELPHHAGPFPAETAFMQRLHRDSPVYQINYELADEADRLAFTFDLCLLGLENEALRSLLGVAIFDWLTRPLVTSTGISALELMLLATCNRPVFADPNALSEEIVHIRQAIDWLVPDRVPTSPPTLRLIGLHTSISGLGSNMRMSEIALGMLGVAPEIVDTEQDLVYPATSPGAFVPSRPIDLFHLNPDEIPSLVSRHARHDRPGTYRIGFALWETSAMPEQHRAGIMLLDEIWVPTRYVADIYQQAGHPRVHVVGKGIMLPAPRTFDLRDLGIAAGTTVFLVSFDLGSWVDRKNPMAAVEAFQRAFANDKDVCLVVKSNGLYSHPGDRTRQVARLRAAAEQDRRIILLSKTLDFRDYLGLIAAVSATVSPHRSEGFGYVPAYSMLLNTPTIVTDHSGVCDFCMEETSFPVRAQLHPLATSEFVFDTPGAMWAHIDLDHLAESMRAVRADPIEAARRARNGKELVQTRYSMEALAARYRERLLVI